MVEVVRTNFAPIFSDCENFPVGAQIVAPPNDDFQICSIRWKGISSPKKDANGVKIGLEKKLLLK